MKLQGRTALITGANRGIGRGCAIEMAREGASILVNYRGHKEEAESVVAEVRGLGQDALLWQADVANRAQVESMVEGAIQHFGKVDILVNNAATSVRKPFLDMSEEEVALTWGVTLWGPFHCSQLVARRWVERNERGRIIMISSIHAATAYPTAIAYNAAKAGLNHMARTMAVDLVKQRINVNIIEPGWIDTPGERALLPDEMIRERAKLLPWGRMGTSEEIGRAAVFLASDDADYITGATLRVDGGLGTVPSAASAPSLSQTA